MSYNYLSELLRMMPIRRKVFISYHHENDQTWADALSNSYCDQYEIFFDNSLDDEIDSANPEYVNRVIREDYIVGSSITIVLCGAETWKRRYVDWEICSTLHHEHALLGICLPSARRTFDNKIIVPDRLHANIQSGYAHWISWPVNGDVLKAAIETSISNGRITSLIDNCLPKMQRNKT